MEPIALTPKELRRFHRQMLLPGMGQQAQQWIKDARVLVIGAGGLGSAVLQNLSAVGIGRIGILDFAAVDEDGLMRQSLYGDKDLGKLKAIIAREKLQQYNPMTEFEVINTRLTRDNILSFLNDYHWVVDATNHDSIHFLINDACVILGKPLLFGYTGEYHCQAALLNLPRGPSLRCLYPDSSELRKCTESSTAGIMAITCHLAGSLMTWEMIQGLTHPEKPSGGMLVKLNLPSYRITRSPIQRIERNFDIKELEMNY
jgi:molybdopterin/thiamine biosynthesis adenylyltransferase